MDGKSTSRRLSAGYRFSLEEHSIASYDGDYVVTKVLHRGVIPEGSSTPVERVYSNAFVCTPSTLPFRPKAPRHNLQQVLESAIVVGPVGEEIFTDEYGRIKVQFHWDREGKRNGHSSCWLRVAHDWSGAAWGFQFIPRIGMEVLVSFLGGDEDRPVVVGCVYNKTHPVPFQLPQQKTRSGIRTQSTPGGNGFNELSFEDSAGNELVNLHAQKDHIERVGNDQTLYIAHNQTVNVGNVKVETVKGGSDVSVGGDASRSVDGSHVETVGKDQRVIVKGTRSDQVMGPLIETVNGASIVNKASRFETVEGYASLNVGVEGKETAYGVTIYGAEVHDVTQTITLRADKGITFKCGDTSLSLTPDGIKMETKKLSGKAKESVTLTGNGPVLQLTKEANVMADTINLYSKGGVLQLDKDTAQMNAPQVNVGVDPPSVPPPTEDGTPPKTKPFKWKMMDPNLEPYKNKTYTLVTQGFKTKGTTDGSGTIDQQIPDDAFLVQIMLWTDDYPTGETRSFTFRLVDLPASTSVYGAQLRLKNLGYYQGAEGDVATPDFKTAVMQFQLDHALDPTGELDGKTSGKLDEIHPT